MRWDTVFIGRGGISPGIEALNVESGDSWPIVELPRPHSVYSMAFDGDNSCLAAGTKGGLVYLLSNYGLKREEWIVTHELVQDGPVLSVHWLDHRVLAATDITRQCLLWEPDREPNPKSIETNGQIICSLAKVDGMLAGLSSEGILLFWDLPEGRLIRESEVGPPPSISALVRMIWWPATHSLVCPGSNGKLNLYDIHSHDRRCIDAHQGEAYSVALFREKLLTVGEQDGKLKVWSPFEEKTERSFDVPRGVVSIGIAGGRPAKVLLVSVEGKAFLFGMEECELKPIGELSSEGYRMVIDPDSEKLSLVYVRHKQDRAEDIVSKISNSGDGAPEETIQRLHSDLIELGYRHVSLALQVEAACMKGNIIQALKCSASLLRVLPHENPRSLPSLERHAGLLVRTWQILEANRVCRKIEKGFPSYPLRTDYRILAETMSSEYVIEPDIPISSIIEAATLVESQFVGRYVLKRHSPKRCNRARFDSVMMKAMYTRIQQETGQEDFPPMEIQKVGWISREKVEEIELLVLDDRQSSSIRGLQVVLQVFQTGIHTLVLPIVLFDWRPSTDSVAKENQNASSALTSTITNRESSLYLASIHSILQQTLRRLVTKGRSLEIQ